MLELMDCDLYKDPGRYQAHLNLALEQLRIVRSLSYLPPAPESPALFAFDPYAARRLNTFGPLRTHELPTQEKVWEALEGFLNDCDELRLMCSITCIATWEVRSSHDLVVSSFTKISTVRQLVTCGLGRLNLARSFRIRVHVLK